MRPPGFEPGSSAWQELRVTHKRELRELEKLLKKFSTNDVLNEFYAWMVNKCSQRYSRNMVRELGKPPRLDKKNSVLAYRNFLHFLEERYGLDVSKFLDFLKIPRTGVDLRIPTDREILDTYHKILGRENKRLLDYFLLLLDSGARRNDIAFFLKNRRSKVYEDDEIIIFKLSYLRGYKKAFYIYLLKQHYNDMDFNELGQACIEYYSRMTQKYRLVAAKYIRKWVASKMFSLEIPESVIDFIQGRTPRSILLKHYVSLYTISIKYYKKYAKYLKKFLGGK